MVTCRQMHEKLIRFLWAGAMIQISGFRLGAAAFCGISSVQCWVVWELYEKKQTWDKSHFSPGLCGWKNLRDSWEVRLEMGCGSLSPGWKSCRHWQWERQVMPGTPQNFELKYTLKQNWNDFEISSSSSHMEFLILNAKCRIMHKNKQTYIYVWFQIS